ncbi:MAG: OmpA family protein [Myxococcota bacterium]
MRFCLAVVAVCLCGTASAQTGDEWSTFPPAPSAAPAEPKAPPEAPAKGLEPEAKKRVEERLRKAEAKKEGKQENKADGDKVVSTQERYLPGSEPHSPSTWGKAYNDRLNLRVAPGVAGIGLLHVGSADLGRKGLVRFSVTGEYMAQNDFPVRRAENIRSAGTFCASFVPLEFVETYLAYAAAANTNSRSSPNLIQALGDITLGAKASRQWAKGFYGGVELAFTSYSAVGNQGLNNGAVGLSPRVLATYDVREALPKVPARVHGNVGFIFDGTGALVQNHTLNAAEEFALNVNRFNRFALGLAVEAPLPAVTPFLEYALELPLGVEGGQLVGPDGVLVPATQAMPQTLGLGLKVTAVKDLTLLAAVDFGLTRSVGLGVPATPPFNFLFGAAFNIDPFQRGETKLVETVKERPLELARPEPPKTGKVAGTVLDAATKKPIPGVIVAMVGAGLPPVASDADSGRFLTHDLPSGPVKLVAHKDGYKELAQEVQLEAGQTATVELTLESEAKKARFDVLVTEKKKPVAAQVSFKGPAEHQAVTEAAIKDPVRVELPAGRYVVNVTAEGYLAQTRDVQVSEGAAMPLSFELVPQPKKKLVVVKENKIEILQQVHFATAKATILADSFSLLAQVVDAIVKHDVKRLRIEGHTDNKGAKAKNQKLSEDRAAAVADFLAAQGIDRARIETAGLGDSRPVAPNLTARGRELNRRVEFVILER